MKDPFFAPPEWLSTLVRPVAESVSFQTLPLHAHEVLLAFSAYTVINIWVSPWLSTRLFGERYTRLSRDKKLNWDVHVVSLTQSTLISALALWVMRADGERAAMDWQQRVWGYTGASGMIQGLAAGYFLWDLMITLQNVRLFGPGMLAHAVCALLVFSLGFLPFVNYYAPTFILYELSSPFLNFHWFFDKLNMTGSNAQLYNGIVLLVVFFCCRLVWGTYSSLRVYQDIWRGLHYNPALAETMQQRPGNDVDIMRFAGDRYVPVWLALAYLGSNLVLNTLNFFWFGKMIETIRKRFQPAGDEAGEKPLATRTTGADGKVTIGVDEVRRRQVGTPVPAAI